MKFTIEQRHLTDTTGRPIADAGAVSFHTCDADTVDEAVQLFMTEWQAEVIGDVLKFPGFQAVATMRNATGVYTLQVGPASQSYVKV